MTDDSVPALAGLPQCEICQMDGVRDSPATICCEHYRRAVQAEFDADQAALAGLPSHQEVLTRIIAEMRAGRGRYPHDPLVLSDAVVNDWADALETLAGLPSSPQR